MFDVERVRSSWQREVAAIDAVAGTINEHTAHEPLRSDGWTAHDLLGHIANAARGLGLAVRNGALDAVNLDEFNEQQRQRGRERSWPEVQAYWAKARDEVGALLAEVDAGLAEQAATVPHLPMIQTRGDALRALILHTRSHREELERGFSDVQA